MITPDLSIIVKNANYFLDGIYVTLLLTVVASVGSFLLGILLATSKRSHYRIAKYSAIIYIDMMRITPLIMVIFWIYFFVPTLTGKPTSALISMSLALTLYNASYMAEIIRSGADSVPKGLMEAARSSGLSMFSSYRYVLLPLAISNTMPALITRLVSIVMGSSLSYIVAVPDFFRVAYNINSRAFSPFEIYGFVALVYFCICYGLSLIGSYFEKKRQRYL